jgi:hypothetical protein
VKHVETTKKKHQLALATTDGKLLLGELQMPSVHPKKHEKP